MLSEECRIIWDSGHCTTARHTVSCGSSNLEVDVAIHAEIERELHDEPGDARDGSHMHCILGTIESP